MTYQQPWRLFTLEEAKEALVAIEPLAREAQQKVGELQSLSLNPRPRLSGDAAY